MKHPSTRFTLVAVLTVFAAMVFVSTWVHAFRSDAEDRGNTPELIVEKRAADKTLTSKTASSSLNSRVATSGATSSKKTPETLPATYPARLVIPSLGVDADVQRVGITAKGNMGIPSNFSDVGWYSQGVIPGNFGNALIDGHVDNALGLPGVFSNLEELKIGDEVIVKTVGGKNLTYVVTSSVWYDYRKVPMAEMVYQKNVKGLKLITCGGVWIQDSKMYDQRLVVSAVLKE